MDNTKTRHFFRSLFFALTLGSSGLSQAGIFDDGFDYIYSLSKNDFTVAHVKRSLLVSNNKITFNSYSYPVGFASLFVSDTITEKSILDVSNNTFLPLSYSYVKQADEIKKQFHLKFDRINNTVTDSRLKTPFKLTTDTFDPLSFQLALAKTLATSQPKLSFTLVDNKSLKTYRLKPEGDESLKTDVGDFKTQKFSYFDEAKQRKVLIWCAPQLDYLPVKVKRIDNDGDYGTLTLISLQPGTKIEAEDNIDY